MNMSKYREEVKITDKYDDDYYWKKKKEDIYFFEKEDESLYKLADEYCDKMNGIKYSMLQKAKFAFMGQVVVSNFDKPIIGTQALDTCYGILFYDRNKKEGICGHAVPSNLTGVLAEMINLLGTEERTIEYMILPGFRNVDRRDYSGLQELSNYLLLNLPKNIHLSSFKYDNSSIKMHMKTLSYEFAFDTSKGEFVTRYVFFDSVENNPRYMAAKPRM